MEYKINENSTFYVEPALEAIKYTKEDGSSLHIEFKACSAGENEVEYRESDYFALDIYTLTPEQVKLDTLKLEKQKKNLIQKLFAKQNKSQADTEPEIITRMKKETLFYKEFERSSDQPLESFLIYPLELSGDYQSIQNVVEKARKEINEIGRPMHKKYVKEQEQKRAEQQETLRAQAEKKAHQERLARDKAFADKIKGFEL